MHHQSNLGGGGGLAVPSAQPLRNAVLRLLVVGVVWSRTTVEDDAQRHIRQVVHRRRNVAWRELALQHCHEEVKQALEVEELAVISVEVEHRGQAVQNALHREDCRNSHGIVNANNTYLRFILVCQ